MAIDKFISSDKKRVISGHSQVGTSSLVHGTLNAPGHVATLGADKCNSHVPIRKANPGGFDEPNYATNVQEINPCTGLASAVGMATERVWDGVPIFCPRPV